MTEVIESCGVNAALVHSFVPDERKVIPMEAWGKMVPGMGTRAIRSALHKLEKAGYILIIRPHATAMYLYSRNPAAGLPYVRASNRPSAPAASGLMPQEHQAFNYRVNSNNKQNKTNYPTKQQLYDYFEQEGYKGAAECWGEFGKDWRTSKGERIQHWRSFVAAIYFTPENQKQQTDEYGI